METNLTQEQSFEIINKMILSAKEKMRKNDAFFFLYWGYVIIIASLVAYVGLKTKQYYLTYAWFLPFAAIPYSVYKGMQLSKTTYAKTYLGSVISALWTSFGISLVIFIVLVITFFNEYYLLICPVSLFLVAIGIFTTGKAFNFKPLIWGAIVCWAGAIMCLIFRTEEQYLIYPIAMFFGYIVPGHLIRRKANV